MNDEEAGSRHQRLQTLAAPDVEAVTTSSPVAYELALLGARVMAQPRPALRQRRSRWRSPVAAAVAVLALGSTAAAATATSGFGLLSSGYVGDDTLIDTTAWRGAWEARVDAYAWPTGFDRRTFIDGQVAAGASRPDAVPSQDLDYEVLALNSCSWMTAYEVRGQAGDVGSQRATVDGLRKATQVPAYRAMVGLPLPGEVEALLDSDGPSLVQVQTFLDKICGHELVRSAVKDVR